MAINDHYKTLTLMTPSENKNNRGGAVTTWAETSFQGLINQLKSEDIEINSKMGVDADYKLFCPVNVAITRACRVKDGSRTYRVASEPKDTVGRGHHYKVMLKRTSSEDLA
jgi:head-tail adaptor